MGVVAGELLEIMDTRLAMQDEGTTNPAPSVKTATRELVEKLSIIDASETIKIITVKNELTRYVRASSGEILAEFKHDGT